LINVFTVVTLFIKFKKNQNRNLILALEKNNMFAVATLLAQGAHRLIIKTVIFYRIFRFRLSSSRNLQIINIGKF